MLYYFFKININTKKMNDLSYNYYEYSSNLFYYRR